MPREKEPIIARLTRGEKEREFSRPSAAKEIYPFMPLPPLRSLTLTLFSPALTRQKTLQHGTMVGGRYNCQYGTPPYTRTHRLGENPPVSNSQKRQLQYDKSAKSGGFAVLRYSLGDDSGGSPSFFFHHTFFSLSLRVRRRRIRYSSQNGGVRSPRPSVRRVFLFARK